MLSVVACGDAEEERAQSGDSAFTVANGDRFVVSATPDKIVLKKRIGSAEFPFDEESLRGKAILIHPVSRRAELGVYARAMSVTSTDDTYVIDGEPLTLKEMETISEDDVVRIFIDPHRDIGVQPQSLTPQTVSWLTPGGFSFGFGAGLAHSTYVAPGLTFSHSIERSDVQPEVLVDWTEDHGLEIGFRASLSWRSTITFKGTINGGKELVHSQELTSPPWVVTIPIGVVPVPVALTGTAFVTCSANGAGSIGGTVKISADASLGGSVYIQPSVSLPSEWVSEGRWPAQASATASADPDVTFDESITISCALPRIAVKAAIGGAAGPYLALAPTLAVTNGAAKVSASVVAGVEGKVMGVGGSFETTVATWTP